MIFVCLNYVPDIVLPWPNKGKICHSVYIIFFEAQLNLKKKTIYVLKSTLLQNKIININHSYLNQNS